MLNTTSYPLLRVVLVVLVAVAFTSSAVAQLPAAGTPWQFDITGFIQKATLGGANCGTAPTTGALACGTITVNGHVITVPSNTIVTLPANQLTWAELFSKAPAPYLALGLSGLAMADVPAPLTTYQAHVVGNVMPGATAGAGVYVAGLIGISQDSLNSGAGYITALTQVTNPLTGLLEMEIQVSTGDPIDPLTRVRINDPVVAGLTTGRYTAGQSPDVRFAADQDNPTITAGTGFPHCLYATSVAQCPQTNRPLTVGPPLAFAGSFFMNIPGSVPDPTFQAPLEVGDYITFAGNLVQDCAAGCLNGATGGPWPLAPGGTYISAHTITSNIAIFTQPRVDPAYARLDVSLIGTGGLTVLGVTEAVIRTRFEGFSTDKSREIHVYGVDTPIPPATAYSDRDWGTIGVDPGPPLGAVQGRWRFRPPCLPFGTVPTKLDKQCVMNSSGSFLPVTREVKAVIETPACPAGGTDPITGAACPAIGSPAIPSTPMTVANGLTSGSYKAPIAEYIFVENIPGTPVPPSDFNSVPFLAQGGYFSTTGVQATGALNPWPGTVVPTPLGCSPPTATAGGPYQVASGGTVTLNGTAGGTTPTFSWAVTGGSLSSATVLNPLFTAPAGPATVTATLTVTACTTSASSIATITVNAPTAPTVSYVPVSPVIAQSGTPTSIVATGVDPGGLKVDVTWSYTATPPVGVGGLPTLPLTCKGTTSTTQCALNFTPTIPLGGTQQTIFVQVVATNSAGIASAADATTVTVMPIAGAITVTSAEYRTSKQRLIINATDSIISPAIVLTLQPYLAKDGTTYNPCTGVGCTFTNNGGGLYILDLVGAPAPACNPPDTATYATPCSAAPLDVKGSDGGDSGFFRLTRIRQ